MQSSGTHRSAQSAIDRARAGSRLGARYWWRASPRHKRFWQRFALGTFAWKPGIMLTIGEYEQLFDAHGGTDATYLRHHFLRYTRTKQRLLSNWDRSRGNRVLDVGAHWLHQALMYARDGFSVTAIDMPVTLETDCVRRLAKAY